MWVGITWSIESMNRTKGRRIKEFPLSLSRKKENMSKIYWTSIYLAFRHQSSWLSGLWALGLTLVGLQFSGLWLCIRADTMGSPGSQAFWLGLNYTSNLPGSPVYRQQTVGFLSLRNDKSPYLIINPSPPAPTYWFCFSREFWHTNRLLQPHLHYLAILAPSIARHATQ